MTVQSTGLAQPLDPGFYADFGKLAALKRGAQTQDPEALRAAARQFESLFTQMLIESMRAASFGDSLFGSDQTEFYQSLFDEQLAVELSKSGGLGLADLLVEQLTRAGIAAPAGSSNREAAATAALGDSEPQKAWRPASREEFVRELWPHAEAAGRELGVDPRALLAQAALETDWGRAIPRRPDGTSSFNLFGIKAGASWSGPTVGVPTIEFEHGIPVRRVERFRAYDSLAESFRDYAALVRNSPRYGAVLGTGSDVQAFAGALQSGGYATDPAYAEKIAAVARSVERLIPDGAPSVLKVAGARPILSGGEAG
ncbi:MAG: glucosaminidase domain-containing protein [Pseudomonadota bacterium]